LGGRQSAAVFSLDNVERQGCSEEMERFSGPDIEEGADVAGELLRGISL
jgi:hypothetical protein